MEALSIIALVLLTLVGYSSGMVMSGRGRDHQLYIFDLIIVIVLWIGVFTARVSLGRWWTVLLGIILGIIVGFAMGTIKLTVVGFGLPKSELPEHALAAGADQKGFFRRIWAEWTLFSQEMGRVQGRLLLSFFYFVIVTPFGMIVGWPSDFLKIKEAPTGSNWKEKEAIDRTVESAQEQG